MMYYDDALTRIPDTFSRKGTERVPLREALGRAVPAPVVSETEHPPFAKAAMDGYALGKDDTSDEYEVLETLAAGDVPSRRLTTGTCSKIMTGAMLPDGADRVVRVEYTREENGRMRVIHPETGDNVIQRGENLEPGQLVLTPRVLRPQDIGVLASLGMAEVAVSERPTVGIIATGSELREPGRPLERGQIYNSNGHELYAQIQAAGGQAYPFGIVRDDPDALLETVQEGLARCDLLLLSGGVSMGAYDYVPRILERAGVTIAFHKVAIKPGKPTLYGYAGNTEVIGLPGNPVSVFVLFEVLVRKLLLRRMGVRYQPSIVRATTADEIRRRNAERLEFRPVELRDGLVYTIPFHGSSHVQALANANGLIQIEIGCRVIPAGTEVDVRQI